MPSGRIGVASEAQLADAITANLAAEDALKNFGPLWSEAERLDAELAAARTELSDAMETSLRAEAALRDQANALATINQTLGQTAELHRATTAQLNIQSGRVLIADRLRHGSGLASH